MDILFPNFNHFGIFASPEDDAGFAGGGGLELLAGVLSSEGATGTGSASAWPSTNGESGAGTSTSDTSWLISNERPKDEMVGTYYSELRLRILKAESKMARAAALPGFDRVH